MRILIKQIGDNIYFVLKKTSKCESVVHSLGAV